MANSRQKESGDSTLRIKKFTSYQSRRQHTRKHSYATVEMSDNTQEVYRKIRFLGDGAYGTVYLMQSTQTASYLVVKEIMLPFKEYQELSQLKAALKETNLVARHETQMYNIISESSNGFAYEFRTKEKIRVQQTKNSYKLITYPHNYIIMDFIDKTLIDNVSVKSQNDLCNLFIATLKALQIIHHKNIMHGDIKVANIFAWKDDENRYMVRFIDTSLSLFFGELVDIAGNLPDDKNETLPFPPEYFEKDSATFAHASQDIYALGRLFINLFLDAIEKKIISKHVKKELKKILSTMVEIDPNERSDTKNLIENIKFLKKHIITKLTEEEIQLYLQYPNENKFFELETIVKSAVIPQDLQHNYCVLQSVLNSINSDKLAEIYCISVAGAAGGIAYDVVTKSVLDGISPAIGCLGSMIVSTACTSLFNEKYNHLKNAAIKHIYSLSQLALKLEQNHDISFSESKTSPFDENRDQGLRKRRPHSL